MPTSELSDALNPYASQARYRQSAYEYSPQSEQILYQPVVQPVQQHVPHVSELEMAITEPAPQPPARPRQILAELMGMIAATQQAHEAESQRRLAWEQEQETKYAQRQADMEQKMLDMFEQLKALRSTVNSLNNPPSETLAPQTVLSPAMSQLSTASSSIQPITPTSPMAQPAIPRSQPQPQSIIIQGSSRNPLSAPPPNSYYRERSSSSQVQPYQEHTFQVSLPPMTLTPDTSQVAETSDQDCPQSPRPEKRKKKRKSPPSSSDGEHSGSSSSTYLARRARKRKNHHDTRCYTIQHAMRLHILRMMELDTDKELSDSHIESTTLGPSDPVRFVWDKTPKQSVHNGRMKKRIIDDIKENRTLYKHVASKEFNKKQLDTAFEQCFVTLRQKFKNQRDEAFAINSKQREDMKARKARHLSRRKVKLTNRSEVRNNIAVFEHVTFDGALHQDCMSSEESDVEVDPRTSESISILRTRGNTWRSKRLLRFYDILDDEERTDSSAKPRRGVGKRERRVGPPKEGFILPPEGIATWMISKRWYKSSLTTHPDLPVLLKRVIVDPSGFDWYNFGELGDESSDEQDTIQPPPPPPPAPIPPQQHHLQKDNFQLHNINLGLPQQHYTTSTFVNFTL